MYILDNLIDISHLPSLLLDYLLYPFITVIACLLSVFVVLGNLLVVTAIWHENQLHSVTNYLIASLAAADCLVGAVVMPFSIISEIIIGSWTFGPTWCDLWHSFDVLASTASIMNLCAISLDRYLAITNPICYPTKMTPHRVALLIMTLWTCSSLISFPAIIWWRAVGKGPLQAADTDNNIEPPRLYAQQQIVYPQQQATQATQASQEQPAQQQQQHQQQLTSTSISLALSLETPAAAAEAATTYRCVFTDDPYYLLFSSFVSFYGPLCVMLYAYYRIYKAAVKQTRFLKHGSKYLDNNDGQDLYLRAHRGGGNSPHVSKPTASDKAAAATSSNSHYKSNNNGHDFSNNQHSDRNCHDFARSVKLPTSRHPPSSSQILISSSDAEDAPLASALGVATSAAAPIVVAQAPPGESPERSSKGQILYYDSDKLIQGIVDLTAMHYIDCSNQPASNVSSQDSTSISGASSSATRGHKQHPVDRVKLNMLDGTHVQVAGGGGGGAGGCGGAVEVPRQQRNVGKKLAKERKAAKTLGIVVGVFILCWLPFFVVNILVALCGTSCIYKPQILFSIVTWLGWLNSAMNPVIYACWSRDFRRAFRKVLCTWVEFLCYDGTTLAKKLRLKAESSYQNTHEVHLNRTASTFRGGGGGAGNVSAATTEVSTNCVGGGGSFNSCTRAKTCLSSSVDQ